MRVGLDIDGVCAEFEDHFLSYFGLPRHPATSWDDARFRDNFHRTYDDYFFWVTMPTIINPADMKFEPVIYVTARPVPTAISADWLEYQGYPKAEVICVGEAKTKVDALAGKVDYFLDDAIHNFEELNENGINCLLVSRHHNRGYEAGDKRVASILDFQIKYLNK